MKGPPSRPELESTCNRMTDAWWNICLSCWQRDPESRPSASKILANIELTLPLYVFLAYPLLYVNLCCLGWMLQIQSLELWSATSVHVVSFLSGSFLLLVLVFGDRIMPTNLPENCERHIFMAFIVDFTGWVTGPIWFSRQFEVLNNC